MAPKVKGQGQMSPKFKHFQDSPKHTFIPNKLFESVLLTSMYKEHAKNYQR